MLTISLVEWASGKKIANLSSDNTKFPSTKNGATFKRNSLRKFFRMTDLAHFVQNGKKIIGVATNYKSLLKILQRPTPQIPEIFLKPTTSYITEGQPIIIPQGFSVNEEVELGVIIGKNGKQIPENEAMNYVGGYCVALDMTATCKMKEARSKGGSWTVGKGFDTACPVGQFIPKNKITDPHNIKLWCKVNGELKQDESTSDMLFSIPVIINFVSQFMTLEENDLIITGSPPGMGPIKSGDVIEGGIENVSNIKFCVS